MRKKRDRTTGLSKMREYRVWVDMRTRCYSENSPSYFRYGGRGIKVCEQWKESFLNFLADMGPRPSSEYSLDRINNDGDYEPSNCRWATRKQQMRNTRMNHLVEGTPISELAEKIGVTHTCIRRRLRLGQPLLMPKGTRWGGENRPNAKLNNQAVIEIRAAISSPQEHKKINEYASKLGVLAQTVRLVVARETWRHI